jgi:hypothetical protein
MSIQVIRAEEFRSMGGTLPRLELILEDTEPNRRIHSDIMGHLFESGTWHRSDEASSDTLIYAADGDYHTSRNVRMDPEGKYSVHGDDGTEWKHSWFTWQNITFLPSLGDMVQVSCHFQGWGNIHLGLFAKSLVEAKIKEAGLDFAVQGHRVIYTGPKDRFRDIDVYPNYNGITWGVTFRSRAYEGACPSEVWGGAYWPDEATARAVAATFIKDGTKDMCANLDTLKERFPNHPSVSKVADYLLI